MAKLLGHEDVSTTQRYAHHYPESLRDGVEILDSLNAENAGQFHDSFTLHGKGGQDGSVQSDQVIEK